MKNKEEYLHKILHIEERELNFIKQLSESCANKGKEVSLLNIAKIDEVSYGTWGDYAHRRIERNNSNFLYALFNNKDNGETLIKSFIKEFWYKSNLKISKVEVYKEKLVGNKKYIDILLYKKEEFAIILENKITEYGFQKNQIANYISGIKEDEDINIKENNIYIGILPENKFYYPSDCMWKEHTEECENCNGLRECENRSYKKDFDNMTCIIDFKEKIINWLEKEVKEAHNCYDCYYLSALIQYLLYLKKRYMKMDENRFNEIRKKIQEKTDIDLRERIEELKRIESDIHTIIPYLQIMEAQNYLKEIYKEEKTVTFKNKTDDLSDPEIFYEYSKDNISFDVVLGYNNGDGYFYGIRYKENTRVDTTAKQFLDNLKINLILTKRGSGWYGWEILNDKPIEKRGQTLLKELLSKIEQSNQ